MAIRADVTNFRNIREAHLHDDESLSLIVGYNESGKSSLVGALQYALTGTAFNHRGKECSKLVTRGEERMHVRVNVGALSINRSLASGDTIKGIADQLAVPSDVLPALFDASQCVDGGSKALKAFLNGAVSDKFDCAEHFKNDPDISACISLAKRSGRASTKQLIEYCEIMRAGSKEPPIPTMPSLARPSPHELTQVDTALAAAKVEFDSQNTLYSECRNTLNNYKVVSKYLADVAAYAKLLETHDSTDGVAQERAYSSRVAAINVNTLDSIKDVLSSEHDDGKLINVIAEAAAALRQRIALAKQFITLHPPPKSLPPAPVFPAAAQPFFAELQAANLDTAEAVEAGLRETSELFDPLQGLGVAAHAEVERLSKTRDSLLLREGQWQAYDSAVPAYEIAKAKANSDWQRWDFAAKSIAKAENEHVNSAGDKFGSMVSDFAGFLLQGRRININRDTGIMLGDVNIADCTISTQWRIGVCVMAAIARSVGSPLLLVDAADILDEQNKACLIDFLLKQIVPYFSHVVVTATCRGKLEDEKPASVSGVSKWTLRNGVLSKLK